MAKARITAGSGRLSNKVREQALYAGCCCVDKKAEEVVVLDLRKLSDLTDFFVVCEGFTDIHVRSVAEHVIEGMEKKYEARPTHVEGMENGRWVLIDYFDFVVHVFHPEARRFYQLERLWADAPSRAVVEGTEERGERSRKGGPVKRETV